MNTLDDNKTCADKMCKLLEMKHNSIHLKDVTREIITNRMCAAPLLKAFIMVRKSDLPKSKLPNKGTVYKFLRLPNSNKK